MFLTKMVKDFLETIKTSNQDQLNQGPNQNHDKTRKSKYKTNKKLNRSKKFPTKASLNIEESEQLPQTSSKKEVNFRGSSKPNNKSVAPTKVKSASWKRSEKSINPYNTLSNKKHKSLRKKSPNWLKFPNSKLKLQDSNQLVNAIDTTSACKPGTLYSDVLFGASSSNLVKIKNSTPRQTKNTTTTSTAQKKLSKALFKFSDRHKYETSDESEIEDKKNLFPALQKINNKISSSCLTKESISCNTQETIEKQQLTTDLTPSTSPNKKPTNEELKEIIFSDFQSPCSVNRPLDDKNDSKETISVSNKDNKFLLSSILNIPKWNYTNADTATDAFPKFLCQFDDENYLKAEKIACLGLKLALGNTTKENQTKF